MMLEEAQARLKKTEITTQEQLWQISPIYCLLGFDKDDFCKLVDTLGIEKWTAKAATWERLDRAERELAAKERYLTAKARLEELAIEKEGLEQIVNGYKSI